MKGPEPVISQIIDKLKHINQVCCSCAGRDGSGVGGFQISSASPGLSLGSDRHPGCLHLQQPWQPCVQSWCHPAQHQAHRAHVAGPLGCLLLWFCVLQPPRTQPVPGSCVDGCMAAVQECFCWASTALAVEVQERWSRWGALEHGVLAEGHVART